MRNPTYLKVCDQRKRMIVQKAKALLLKMKILGITLSPETCVHIVLKDMGIKIQGYWQ
jgi:hypothetical protein